MGGFVTMTPVPHDHPLMIAWNAFKATEEYANSAKWAALPQHLEGSLWALFAAGFRSGGEALQARADAAEAENRCDVCDGRPLESGRECMCGGTGKKSAAVQYLRERVVTLEAAPRERDAEIERLRERFRSSVVSIDAHQTRLAESRRLLEQSSNVLLAAYRLLRYDEDAPNILAEIDAALNAIRVHLAGGER